VKVFSQGMWNDVARRLRWGALRWWRRHKNAIIGMAERDMALVALQLRAGNRTEAKLALVRLMARKDFADYRDATTGQLLELSVRRAEMIEALERLGWWSARIIGTAILGAIGL